MGVPCVRNNLTLAATLAATLALSGCMLDQKPNNAPEISVRPMETAFLEGNARLESQIKTSADQQTQHLGAQLHDLNAQVEANAIKVERLAERIEVTGVKLRDATVTTEISALKDSNVKLAENVDIAASKIGSLELKFGAVENKLEFTAKGQAAWNAQMEETKREMHAQRDAIDNSVQFTKDMAGVIERSYQTLLEQHESSAKWQYWTTAGFLAFVIKLQMITGYRSRSRAETRYINELRERQHWQRVIVKLMDKDGDGKLSDEELGGGHAQDDASESGARRGLFGRLFGWLR